MAPRRSDRDPLVPLIERVYDAVAEPEIWRDLGTEIARTLESTSSLVQMLRPGSPKSEILSSTANFDAAALRSYSEYFFKRDVWAERAAQHGLATVIASKDVIGDAEFENTEIYRDYVRKVGVFYVVGTVFAVGTNGALGVFGAHRPREAGGYDETDKR